ncbi:LOW QUALITY PROTEIN: atos homolog protein A [Lethenteron reissneri]|uniref:LOW QUALITY PROTEIN: atos homolog protein A n=1 Tax=Lethenteron reissneri TaxID=7753 RepID=UPI002AB761D5|nr:LOW QUALITY PROTEIN: atos homolog protein A [Lethenteron reissneri]
MKPDGDAPPEGGEWEPEELLVALTQLVTEGRTPEASVKGRAEGPHCPQRAASRHGTHCVQPRQRTGERGCRLYQLTRARVLLLWRNAVPVMVEVGLRAGCCAGGERHGGTCGSEAGDAEGGPCGRGSLLLERWALHLAPRRPGEGAVSEGTLLQAVRSYIHFSQLSAWLSAAHGKLNHSIFYRVCAPGEATQQDFAESPEEHVFPVPALACTRTLRVSVSALPRLPAPPAVQCRVHAPLRPAAAAASSSAVFSAGAAEPGAAEPGGGAAAPPRRRGGGRRGVGARVPRRIRPVRSRGRAAAAEGGGQDGADVHTLQRRGVRAVRLLQDCRLPAARVPGRRRASPHVLAQARRAALQVPAGSVRGEEDYGRPARRAVQELLCDRRPAAASAATAAEPTSELAREAKESSPLGSIYQSREIISSIAQQIDLCELETSLRAVRLGAARDLRRKAESPPAPERCRPGAAPDGTAAPPSSSWRNLKNAGDARAGTPPLTPPLTPVEAALAGDEPERWTPHGEEPAPDGAAGGRGGSETPVSSRGAALPLKSRVKRKLLPSPSPHRPKAAAAVEAARAADPCQSPPAKCGVARPGTLPLDGVRTSPRPPGGPLTPAAPTTIPALVPAASTCYLASSPGIPAGQSASCQLVYVVHSFRGIAHAAGCWITVPSRRCCCCPPPPSPSTHAPACQAASSPVPFRKGISGRFDLDASLLHKNGHVKSPKVVAPADEQSGRQPPAPHGPGSSPRCLLGNFEECVLNARLPALGSVAGFTAELGASGSFCPRHAVLPVHVSFFSVAHDGAPSPYLGVLGLRSHGCRGYHVPRAGTIQVTLFNPNKTVVKMFVVIYDLRDMPGGHHTFLRQRTFSVPAARRAGAPAVPATPGPGPHARHGTNGPFRYLIHLRFLSSKSGKIYLHSDIRLLFSRKSMEIDSGAAYELKSYTETPQNPRYSPRL